MVDPRSSILDPRSSILGFHAVHADLRSSRPGAVAAAAGVGRGELQVGRQRTRLSTRDVFPFRAAGAFWAAAEGALAGLGPADLRPAGGVEPRRAGAAALGRAAAPAAGRALASPPEPRTKN